MNSPIKKFEVKPLTLDDELMKDGLEAVEEPMRREPLFLVGGIAVQSYLPTMCRRPTSDIDFSIVRSLKYKDFKDMMRPAEEYLRDSGYNVRERKHSSNYKLEVMDRENPSQKLLIEVNRMNEQNFKKHKEGLEREIEMAKIKILEERETSYTVAAPEDLAVPKLVRDIGILKRNPQLEELLWKRKGVLSEERVKRELEDLAEFRKEVMEDPSDLDLAERLRLVSDSYDIRILSELAGFNRDYFSKVCMFWDTIKEPTVEREILAQVSLPYSIAELLNP